MAATADASLADSRSAVAPAAASAYPAAVSSSYIYAMHRVNKFHGPDKQVLSDISLSFLPGAKIGVLEIGRAHV